MSSTVACREKPRVSSLPPRVRQRDACRIKPVREPKAAHVQHAEGLTSRLLHVASNACAIIRSVAPRRQCPDALLKICARR